MSCCEKNSASSPFLPAKNDYVCNLGLYLMECINVAKRKNKDLYADPADPTPWGWGLVKFSPPHEGGD